MRRNYSKVIEEMRSTHGLNFVTIAKRIGTDPRTVGKWAQGKHQPNKDSRKKINNLYREVKQNMTTQVSIFDETTGQIMQVVATADFHGQPLDIYGDTQSPWFRAKDVASMIDYSIASMNKFLQSVDEDEKEQKNIPTPGGIQKTWFLTEQGLYEVLFQSRKPIAKEFKKLIKNILKEIRVNGYYMQGELIQDQPPQPAIELNSDMAYIKNRLAELQSMTTMADIKVGLAKTYRIAELMED
ncbi:TPA: BRO-like protein [Streptococcus suis]|nr:BRO-like protein [Streptococcus suis]